MLSIKPVGGTTEEVNYYSNLGEAENHDYYSEDGVRPGMWWGEGAKKLGLSGEVKPEEFKNILEGLSPDGERELVQRRNGKVRQRRAGFDLTWSMPKSFSVAWSQGDREVRESLDRIAEQALYRSLEACQELYGVTRPGGDSTKTTKGKLVVAVFNHDTARGVPGEVPDANRHFHAVIANVVAHENGTSALDARPLFQRRAIMALGAMFRAELSKQLEEKLGLRTYRPKREGRDEPASWWELKGVPPELLKAMSKRRNEIKKWLLDHGLSGAKASEKANLLTREGKKRWTEQELNTEWRKLGREYGFTTDQLKELLQNGMPQVVDRDEEREAALEKALTGLMESKSTFTKNDLLERVAVESQTNGLGIDDVLEVVDQALTHSNEIVKLRDENMFQPRFTTREMLAVERSMLEGAERLNAEQKHSQPLHDVSSVLRDVPTIREEQRKAVQHVCSGSDIACVMGTAGTGKTFMLGEVRKVYERAGYEVIGTTLAAKASRGLEEGSGIRSVHLHKLFFDLKNGKTKLTPKSVLVVDEAGMIHSRLMEEIVRAVESAGAKLVLCGDYRQLQSIGAGGAFRGIVNAVGASHLDEIIRQKEEWARRVVYDLRDGKAENALSELNKRGQLFIGKERDEAMETLVTDWRELAIRKREMKDTLVFAGTNLEVRELNRMCQKERLNAGEISGNSLEVDGLNFYVGDRVMVTRNNHLLNLRNGSTGVVADIQDRVITLRTTEGLQIEIDTDEFQNLALGYAFSAHKGQGITCKNALILSGDSMTDREMSYVEGSRATTFTKLYSDELSSGQIGELGEMMNRSRQKDLAYEHMLDVA